MPAGTRAEPTDLAADGSRQPCRTRGSVGCTMEAGWHEVPEGTLRWPRGTADAGLAARGMAVGPLTGPSASGPANGAGQTQGGLDRGIGWGLGIGHLLLVLGAGQGRE